jgi:mono/diheme cytochrome c family protein
MRALELAGDVQWHAPCSGRRMRLLTPVVLVVLPAGCFYGEAEDRPTPPPSTARELPPLVRTETPPPPVVGGTLLLGSDGRTVVAADPDRDRIWITDSPSMVEGWLTAEIPLEPGDQPFRVVEGAPGTFFVSLRGGGAVVAVEAGRAGVVRRMPVCAAPRGLAYDGATARLHVACASGELVTLDPADGSVTRSLRLERDLRDVLVVRDQLFVSVFRTAEVIVLDGESGDVVERQSPLSIDGFTPAVAWRMIHHPFDPGVVVLLHQLGRTDLASVMATAPPGAPPVYYGPERDGQCVVGEGGALVQSAVSFLGTGSGGPTSPRPSRQTGAIGGVLVVDIAAAPGWATMAVAVAGAGNDGLGGTESVISVDAYRAGSSFGCADEDPYDDPQIVSVALRGDGGVISQSREPPMLLFDSNPLVLPAVSRFDTGHELFHRDPGGQVACASCHAEGGDDALVWRFPAFGDRRTQSLRGGILGTEPFHWDGSMSTFGDLMHEVMTTRMGGPALPARYVNAVAHFVDSIPAPEQPPPADPDAVARGAALFHGEAACASCHAGPELTDSATVDVGTGGLFQVPSLVGIAMRAPFLHDGCAQTLHDRFGSGCTSGDRHGFTSELAPGQIDDLVAYLETL